MKEIKEEEYKGNYYMDYHCRNCGKSYIDSFEYGTRAVQGVCPNCGVNDSKENPDDIFKDF